MADSMGRQLVRDNQSSRLMAVVARSGRSCSMAHCNSQLSANAWWASDFKVSPAAPSTGMRKC